MKNLFKILFLFVILSYVSVAQNMSWTTVYCHGNESNEIVFLESFHPIAIDLPASFDTATVTFYVKSHSRTPDTYNVAVFQGDTVAIDCVPSTYLTLEPAKFAGFNNKMKIHFSSPQSGCYIKIGYRKY